MINIGRLLQYVVLKPEVEGNMGDKRISGGIEFKGVEMTYSQKLSPALRELNLSIKPGEKIAIVGRTGSGKSSLF